MAQLALDAATWRRLSELLDQALEQPPTARAQWLAALPPHYDALKPQLLDLLSRAPASGIGDFMDALPKLELTTTTDGDPDAAKSGELIGPYRLVRKLGHGGMGTVWLAERSDGLINRPVAVKLPHMFAPLAGFAERMAREREILATLDHRNIARLLDAGVTREGQPFLAIEFIAGRTIDQYCADTGSGMSATLAQRLQLFLQVTNALAYAHGMLVLHRDLKPANILVTANGEVCLLDFGIAKLLDHGTTEQSQLTELAGNAMTPSYASPEQVLRQPLTVASDVYSLGVILFELLTGERPYQLKRDSRGALEDAIVQVEPARPSDVAPPAARRQLRGDLDTIVLKALKKKPGDRYATVNALAEDITCYLENRPVVARPDNVWYRLHKFVARNKLGVAAGLAVCVAVIAGTGAALWQAQEATRQRDLALLQQQRAENVKNLVVGIFRDADPDANGGKRPIAADLLRQAATKIETATIDDPLVRAEMLRVLGASLMSTKDFDAAKRILDRASENARLELAPDHVERLRLHVLRGDLLRYLGQGKAWRSELDQVTPYLPVLKKAAPDDYVTALKAHAHWEIHESRYAEANIWAGRAHQAATDLLGVGTEGYVRTLTMLAATHTKLRDTVAALQFAKRAYQGALTLHQGNSTHPTVIDSRRVLALAYELNDEPARALELLETAVHDASTTWGASNATVGYYYQFLSNIQRRLGLLEEATKSARESLAIAQVNDLAADSLEYLARENSLALALLATRNTTEAEPLLRTIAGKAKTIFGPANARSRAFESDHALSMALRGDTGAALDQMNQIVLQYQGHVSPESCHALVVKGAVERMAGRPDAASATLIGVLKSTPSCFRDNDRADALLHLGLAHFASTNDRDAEIHLQSGLKVLESIEYRWSPLKADAIGALSQIRLQQGRASEARQMAEQAAQFWYGFAPASVEAQKARLWLAALR